MSFEESDRGGHDDVLEGEEVDDASVVAHAHSHDLLVAL